ncbi:MAG: flagellar basal body-associated FliL family protein [Smithella sp.]
MKKAKLDLLEDITGIEIEMPGDQPVDPVPEGEEPVATIGKWAFNKLLMIFAPIVLVVLIISGMLIYYLAGTPPSVRQTPAAGPKKYQITEQQLLEKTDPQQNAGSLTALASESWKRVYLKDFMIDLKDAKGNNYVLMCDVAFDVGSKIKSDQLENNAGIRDIICKTAQSRGVVALRSVEERKKMKKELAAELEKILGEGSVKNVYFLNYFIM